jgi:hypothetical protein
LEPFDFALSGHESQDLEFEGHYILIDLRFLNNPKKEIAQVEEEYPAGTLKTAIQKILCPTAISSKSITLTACSILKGDSLSEIKVIFKKL